MRSFIRKYRTFFLVMLVFSVVSISLFYRVLDKKTLPVYNPAMVNPELVDSTIQYIGRNHTIPDFSFTNQNGKTITQENYRGKIYVADFFFTTCGSICPKMTSNLVEVQKAFANNPKVMLLSHTVMPDVDSVPVLKQYAIENGIDDSKWNLVTGDKKQIYTIARRGYLAVKIGKPEEQYDMVHTENLVLVDSHRRVRGFYDGTRKDEVERLISDINWLVENEKK
ncbi:MAG: SCO family protein [Flavobacterium sp.]|nr:MAG: SCO family protein [Flavobacterium sp.]